MFNLKTMLILIVSLTFSMAATLAYATHFRYGTVIWRPLGGQTVEFTIQSGWRRSAYDTLSGRCIDPITVSPIACSGADDMAGVGDIIVEFQGFTQFFPGDGTSPFGSTLGPLLYLVTGIDPANDSLTGFALDPNSLPLLDTTIEHTYPATQDFTATLESCCRVSSISPPNEHINNPDGQYRVETIVDVGSGNTSPSTTMPPFVLCPIDDICEFSIPGADPDGPVTFRMSTSTEAAAGGLFDQPGPLDAPNSASIDLSTGLYHWDTNGATLSGSGLNTLYSTQVTIEDTSSKIAVDFFIQLVAGDPEPPIIDPPSGSDPLCNTTQVLTTGMTRNFDIIASDPDALDLVTLNVAGLPAGATMTPSLPVIANPVSSTFTWTPTDEQQGTSVINFFATSSSGGFALCPVTIEVVPFLPVAIDVRPGSDVNPVNLGAHGVLPVAILSTDDFDATTVNPSSIRLAGAAPKTTGNGKTQATVRDVNGDGSFDLVVHVEIVALDLVSTDTMVTLTGETFDGQFIQGTDLIHVVP
jgi:hypothetical protein